MEGVGGVATVVGVGRPSTTGVSPGEHPVPKRTAETPVTIAGARMFLPLQRQWADDP
jgi:hypothetical protein